MCLFIPKEAARFLRIPPAELLALVAEGQISYVEINGKIRFRCDHLVKFVREHTRQMPSLGASEES